MMDGAATATMPETDWLTGLSSRAVFGHSVDQADRDRDPVAIALIEIDAVSEINRRLGYDVGDDLLRAIGRALTDRRSTSTVVARVGGARFGILTVDSAGGEIDTWLRPIVTTVKSAISAWTFEQIDFCGRCPVEPALLVGVAEGLPSQAWADATTALRVAAEDGAHRIAVFDADDPRFDAIAVRERATERLWTGLDSGDLVADCRPIHLVDGGEREWRWVRLGAVRPRASVCDPGQVGEPTELALGGGPPGGAARLDDGLRVRLDEWLTERAADRLASEAGPLRITVALTADLERGGDMVHRLFSILEREQVPTSRILFEVDESTVAAPGGADFCRRIDRVGSGVVLGGCQGGWPGWRAIEGLPITHLVPHPELVERAGAAQRGAVRILETLLELAAAHDREVIAPHCRVGEAVLADLGFVYREAEPSFP